MKKAYYWFAGVAAFLIFTWVILRVTGVVQIYIVPTPANVATLAPGVRVLTSRLFKPQRMDFICHLATDTTQHQSGVYIHRLCGLPGDTVEIRDAVLYVNGKNMDSTLHVAFTYKIPKEQAMKLKSKYHLDDLDFPFSPGLDQGDSTLISLDYHLARSEGLPPYHSVAKDSADETISKVYHHPWNMDQFGPLIVPSGTYFILGDNRQNSLDSRYLGCIPQNTWAGTVLLRH